MQLINLQNLVSLYSNTHTGIFNTTGIYFQLNQSLRKRETTFRSLQKIKFSKLRQLLNYRWTSYGDYEHNIFNSRRRSKQCWSDTSFWVATYHIHGILSKPVPFWIRVHCNHRMHFRYLIYSIVTKALMILLFP